MRVKAIHDIEIWNYGYKEVVEIIPKGTEGNVISAGLGRYRKYTVRWDNGEEHLVAFDELERVHLPIHEV